MKIIHYIANVSILLGAASLLAAVFYGAFFLSWFKLETRSLLIFANPCFLLGIALYVRELIYERNGGVLKAPR